MKNNSFNFSVKVFCNKTKFWSCETKLVLEDKYFNVCSFMNNLCVVYATGNCFVYNLKTKNWKDLAKIKRTRYYEACTVVEGKIVGNEVGIVGSEVGRDDGVEVGDEVGTSEGNTDGTILGVVDGTKVGDEVGMVGTEVGTDEGLVGIDVGDEDGTTVGFVLGVFEGTQVGTEEGFVDGNIVGKEVGKVG